MDKKTFTPSEKDLKLNWHLINADGEILGRLASHISNLLTGKDKAIYTPNINTGDKVVVINAEKIALTRNKQLRKIYHYVTGYPGGIKTRKYTELQAKKPEDIIRKAVSGMLPKNKLRKTRLANLYIYRDNKHPHQAQLGNTNAKN